MNVRFILLENGSKNPMVEDVIAGFNRRGMFHCIERSENSGIDIFRKAFVKFQKDLGESFFFCENDVVVPDTACWASEYKKCAQRNLNAGMIGSFCDPADFPNPKLIQEIYPCASDEQIAFLSKSDSPERSFQIKPGMLEWPDPDQNPPGRLLWLSTDAITQTGIYPDAELGIRMRAAGYSTKVCTSFRHRHLSLLNAFDIDDVEYGVQRKSFFKSLSEAPEIDRFVPHVQEHRESHVAPIPKPASLPLILAGLVGLGRRKTGAKRK